MNQFLSGARAVVLCAAVVSSVATSSEEDYPQTSGGNDIAVGQFGTSATVVPAGSFSRDFGFAIPGYDLADVVGSQVTLRATVVTGAGWSDVGATLSGPGGSRSMELFADSSNTFTETVLLEDALAGCTMDGGWCESVWNVRFDHVDGSQTVDIDYAVTVTVVGPNTEVQVTGF